jgi:hypothetical protein
MANPGTTVAGITVAALIGVGALAWQASDSAPKDRKAAITSSTAPAPTGGAPQEPQPATATPDPGVPKGSGSGKRVVYSVGQNRVWLVGLKEGKEEVLRTYPVAPGTALTPVGNYRVENKTTGPQSGGDGLKIVNTVVIKRAGGLVYGFSGTETPLAEILAANAPTPIAPSTSPSGTATRKATGKATAKPTTSNKPKNAGVRETVGDSLAMYQFVDIGTLVVVVP